MDELYMKKEAEISQRGMNRLFVLPEDQTIDKINCEHRNDLQKEKIRKIQFVSLHPGVAQFPFIRYVATNCYSLGVKPIVALLLILMVFTIIKAPYFGVSFTGDHSMKYNTYVEPALYMMQKNDITWYQSKYNSDPVDNPGGVQRKFWNIPLYEWGLFATFKLLPFGSIETKTRIYTHFIGLMILIFGFLFLRHWVPARLALLAVLLMALNPMISFSTFVTVLDSMAILFTFLSLFLLNGYFESGRFSKFFLAGIVFGIGNSIKYSMFLWAAPISLLLIYYRRENNVAFVRNCATYMLLGLLCIATNLTSIALLPGTPIRAIISLGIWILLYIAIYIALSRNLGKIDNMLEILLRRKVLLALSLLTSLTFGIFALIKSPLVGSMGNFLTDASILFNHRMYLYMLRIQFKSYMTPAIFWLGIAGLTMIFSTRGGDLKRVASAFLIGSIIYWITASKAMFFHDYYTIIIMISFSLYAAVTLYYIQTNISHNRAKIIVLMLFAVLVIPRSYEGTVSRLGRSQDISGVSQFILNNTRENEIILNESALTPITIYTGRSLVYPELITNKVFREDIRKIGFSNTMRKYKIKYLITQNEVPSYMDLALLYTDKYKVGPRFDRYELIIKTIGGDESAFARKSRDLEDIVKAYNIPAKLKLEAEIGKFRFFSFID